MLGAVAISACGVSPVSTETAPTNETSTRPRAIQGSARERPPLFRIDRGLPASLKLTAAERRAIRLVQAGLRDSARRDLAVAFVPSDGARRIVVFVAPRSNFPYWAGARSLTDCTSRPGGKHYCAWYYVQSPDLVLSTMEQNRCADGEPIWRRS